MAKATTNTNSIHHIASQYAFGPKAFGPLKRSVPPAETASSSSNNLSGSVRNIVEASYPPAKEMLGERNQKHVTQMLTDIYNQGLHMHGDATSVVNQTIVPAFRHVVWKMHQLQPQDEKRIAMARNLAEACQDCQQVQARVILRLYGDLTSQNQTWESQLSYSLVQPKEAALHNFISKHHAPACDRDHTQVQPSRQRAHLMSGYIHLIGDDLGLDGIDAANEDRFLDGCLGVIRDVLVRLPERRAAEAKLAEQKDGIIQKLIQSQMDVAQSKYERSHTKLTTNHKREIAMYVHKLLDEDVIPCVFPDLPPPFTDSEFQEIAEEQQQTKKQKKSGSICCLLSGTTTDRESGGDGEGMDDEALKGFVKHELTQMLCVKEWLADLLGDINNQSPNADRMIDRSCIFEWASANMKGDFKHKIFFDEDRIEDYSDLDPGRPTDDNQFEPFLSPAVLVEMLVQAGMLQRK